MLCLLLAHSLAGPALVPWPKTVNVSGGQLALGRSVSIEAKSAALKPLATVFREELDTAWGISSKAQAPIVTLTIDRKLKVEQYTLKVGDKVAIRGGSYGAVAMGTATFLQALDGSSGKLAIPEMDIRDEPAMGYRGLMIDVARRYHSIPVLKQCVELCRLYRLRYLQLHLTDDQAFTFPSKAFPMVTTVNQHGGPSYTLAELKDLVRYADERGVTIVPEMDIPGHSAALNRAMPELFKIQGTKPYEHHATINFANDKVLAAVNTLIGEMCDVFKSSPYFHMGGDEADYTYADQHPDFQAAFKKYGLTGRAQHEIYRLFISQVDEMVKKRHKKMIVWEGFNKELDSKFPIPKDVLVMAFESAYYLPTELLTDGYEVVNAAWTPLYVVNKHVLQPRKVYDWRPTQFGRYSDVYAKTVWFEAPSLKGIVGAQVCAWEQPETLEISSLRRVVAAMAQRVWDPGSTLPFDQFEPRMAKTDDLLGRLVEPVTIETSALKPLQPDDFDNPTFTSTLTLTLAARKPVTIRYTTDGSLPTVGSPMYKQPVVIDQTTVIRARVFAPDGNGSLFETARTFYLGT